MLKSATGIPLLGLGTYRLNGDDTERCIEMALGVGFRHIDTAQMYGNEVEVGRALRATAIRRQDLFVVTKVDPGNIGAAHFRPSVEKSVAALGGPVDLLLIHWPPPEAEFDAAVDRLVAAQRDGLARAIGVSNFSPAQMARAAARSPVPLINNQVEFHALLDQSAVLDEARRLNMTVTAYSPLARSAVLREPAIQRIAARLGRHASEVALRWIIQQGVAAIPMTTRRENAERNFRALTFALSGDDMAAISALTRQNLRLISPSWMAGRWE